MKQLKNRHRSFESFFVVILEYFFRNGSTSTYLFLFFFHSIPFSIKSVLKRAFFIVFSRSFPVKAVTYRFSAGLFR